MIETTWILVVLTLAASAYALVHVSHLPVAPACPDCRAITGQRRRATLLDRAFAALANAAARECPRCGWAGRMRWRLAVDRARGD